MDFKVTFSKKALRELADITTFIAQDNPEAAREVSEKLVDQAASLGRFPFRHSKYQRRTSVRKVPVSPYLVYYSINENTRTVTILHFWHSARQNPMV